MKYQTRKLPTREALEKVHRDENLGRDVSGIDLVLNLITTVDLIRSSIYGELDKNYHISEGKFNLLMALYAEGEINTGELALRINVTPATVSVMVKRMLAEKTPLITLSRSDDDGRSRLIALSEAGRKLVKSALPEHFNAIRNFAEVLSDDERNALITMLRKLLRK